MHQIKPLPGNRQRHAGTNAESALGRDRALCPCEVYRGFGEGVSWFSLPCDLTPPSTRSLEIKDLGGDSLQAFEE